MNVTITNVYIYKQILNMQLDYLLSRKHSTLKTIFDI